MEAAACARPVVASNVPGCREALQDGVSGLLVEARDAAGLAGVLQRLIDDPALSRKMGLAGRSLAEKKFSSVRIQSRILEVYRIAFTKGRRDGFNE
jgi:glycosyltransferase involved in cell wall biosynthesis